MIMKYYYKDISQNARIRVRAFVPLIEAVYKSGGAMAAKPLVVKGVNYSLEIERIIGIKDKQGEVKIYLFWRDDGEKHLQEIGIVREESHLVRGSYVYYFLYGRYKSKKLYYIGNEFKSREVFSHRYTTQNQSERQRTLHWLGVDSPYRRNGKEYYRDRLTPYGRKCERYDTNELKAYKRVYEWLGKGIKETA